MIYAVIALFAPNFASMALYSHIGYNTHKINKSDSHNESACFIVNYLIHIINNACLYAIDNARFKLLFDIIFF